MVLWGNDTDHDCQERPDNQILFSKRNEVATGKTPFIHYYYDSERNAPGSCLI